MNEARARELYKQIRERAPLASPRFAESYNANLQRLEIAAIDDATGEVAPIAVPLDDCSYDDRWIIVNAPEGMTGLLLLLDLAFNEIRRLRPEPQKKQQRKRDLAANASIMCQQNKAFQRFLSDQFGLSSGADLNAVRSCVREQLHITSFNELNDPEIGKRWQDLRSKFNLWMGYTQ